MKHRILSLLLACALIFSLCTVPSGAADISVSTDINDMKLSGNAMGNYVRGNGMGHSPASSFLYANEDGGVTLVQYYSSSVGVTVAEFDGDLNFLNTRTIPVEGLKKWGGFYAGSAYNYLVYSTGSDTLRIDQYSKDWTRTATRTYTLGNTNSLIHNDLDITEGGGSLFLVSNHYMTSGHQANFRLQVDAITLSLEAEQTGTATYDGYCSHSYVPEVVYSGGTLYAFDRCDSFPGTAIYMSVFGGSLYSGLYMRSVTSMRFNDWGSQGNAIPAGNNGVLTAYTFANWNQENTATNVYLYYASPSSYSTKQVSYSGGAGTPYVASVTDTYGYVLWNPDLYDRTQESDTLYCAAYTLNSGSVTVGAARKIPGHHLSDCEPIQWKGGLIWFTYESKELIFHQINDKGAVTKTAFHKPVVMAAKEATCTASGLTEGLKCSACGEVLTQPEVIPQLAHTEVKTDYVAPTCTASGRTEGTKCSACGEVLAQPEVIPQLSHIEVKSDYVAPTVKTEGRTEGTKCKTCGKQLTGGEAIPKLEAMVEASAENGRLYIAYETNGPSTLILASYGPKDQFLGLRLYPHSYSAKGTISTTIPSGITAYRIMILNEGWSPKCDALKISV